MQDNQSQLHIYQVSQNTVKGFEIYDSMIVVAANENDARQFDPDDLISRAGGPKSTYWPIDVNELIVKCLGVADPGMTPGLIIASFIVDSR